MVNKKIKKINQLKGIIVKLKKQGKRIAFTNGCFDILHYGHVKYLKKAKKLADILVVALNSDSSVKKLKGKNRPITPLRQRMEILAGLETVDFVTSFRVPTPYKVIRTLKPNLIIKGADWNIKDIVGKDIVESYGGKVINIAYIKGISTAGLIKKIAKKF